MLVSQFTIVLTFLPFQLSNQMQLDILNKVKSGELSIDDALKQAKMEQLIKQQNSEDKVTLE